jgi:hypothetical protein
MADAETLEVTITHNLPDPKEVDELFRRRLIALDWGRQGPDPSRYTVPRAKIDVQLFHAMQRSGAAVIAAYKKVTDNRVIGWVEAGAEFVRVNGLLCLPLSKARVIDASTSFLGNLVPRSCTIQRCSNRARGRLAAMVLGKSSPRSIWSLHHHDVEWLVTNYLIVTRMCEAVWSGGRSYEDIDHAGWTPDGHELLAQTTVSTSLVYKKAMRLLELARGDRVLHFFGPAIAEAQCPKSVSFHSIEAVFMRLDEIAAGRWLIDRMLVTAVATDE